MSHALPGITSASGELLDRDTYLHQARLLRALHGARPVMHDGHSKFIHTVTAQQAGGTIEMTVYLAGDPTPIDSAQIALQGEEDAKE